MSDIVAGVNIQFEFSMLLCFCQGAVKANDGCYEMFNLRGDREGYCKKQGTKYLACAPK